MRFASSAVKVFLALTSDGSIDVDKSIEQYAEGLKEYQDSLVSNQDMIASATNAVFDKYKGHNVTKLSAFVMSQLEVNPDNYASMEKQVQHFISENTGEYTSGALFGMRKGAGGGVWRWSDKADDSKEVVDSLKRINSK